MISELPKDSPLRVRESSFVSGAAGRINNNVDLPRIDVWAQLSGFDATDSPEESPDKNVRWNATGHFD
jgi:hypothetical protein